MGNTCMLAPHFIENSVILQQMASQLQSTQISVPRKSLEATTNQNHMFFIASHCPIITNSPPAAYSD